MSDVAGQIADGSEAIVGVMLESFLVDGNQNHETADEPPGLRTRASPTSA